MLNEKYERIVQYWQDYDKRTEEDYNRLLSNFWLLSTCDSNNIEDGKLNYHVTREVFEGSTITIEGVYPKDIIEAQNSIYVRRKIVSNLVSRSPLSSEFIKYLHKVYMQGMYDNRRYDKGERPGQYKVNDYCVGVSDVGSLPENVPSDIRDLCNEVSQVDSSKALTAAAYYHLTFENIHPFSDGNGRIGRLTMNYLLMLNNHPPINIFASDKETYYMALEVFDKSDKISGFIEFLKEQCVKTWEDVVFKKTTIPSLDNAVRMMNK